MKRTISFKFSNDELNRRLVAKLKKHAVKHTIDGRGIIHYSADDEEFVGNDVISSVRDQAFAAWQILSCPADWTRRYRDYMLKHQIPFVEEVHNGQLSFLMPRRHRPHAWVLKTDTDTAKNTIYSSARAKTA